jgi:hypothetical protein
MAVRVTVTDPATGNSVDVDIEPWNTVDELIESVGSYWEKDLGAYVVRLNAYVLRGETQLGNVQVQEGDIFEFIHDPEGG